MNIPRDWWPVWPSQRLVGLFPDVASPTSFSAGYLVALTTQIYVLAAIDDKGAFDAVHFGHVESIWQATQDSPYLRALAKTDTKEAAAVCAEIQPQVTSLEHFHSCVELLLARNELVSLVLEDRSTYFVRLIRVSTEWIEVQEFLENGREDGDTWIRLDQVLRIEAFGPKHTRVADNSTCVAPFSVEG